MRSKALKMALRHLSVGLFTTTQVEQRSTVREDVPGSILACRVVTACSCKTYALRSCLFLGSFIVGNWLLQSAGFFASCLQDYNREIGACMLHLKEHEDPVVPARMQDLAIEALNVTGRTMLKPTNHRAILNSRLDDATPVSHKPGKAFYQGVLVSAACNESHML